MEVSNPTVGGKRPRAPVSSRVMQMDVATGRVIRIHHSKEAAAAAVGGLETFISTCLSGVVDEAYGFGWRYPTADEEEEIEAMQRAEERQLSLAQETASTAQQSNPHEVPGEVVRAAGVEDSSGPLVVPDDNGVISERADHLNDVELIENVGKDDGSLDRSPDVIMEDDDMLEYLASN